MSIINILTTLPSNIKERISQPTALRINNDSPGLYLSKEDSLIINEILKEYKDRIKDDDAGHVKFLNTINKVIDENIK